MPISKGDNKMNDVFLLIVSIFVFLYLGFTLLYPERF